MFLLGCLSRRKMANIGLELLWNFKSAIYTISNWGQELYSSSETFMKTYLME